MKLQIFSKHSATCALVGLEKRSAYRRSSAPSQTFKRPDIRFSATETVSDQSVPEGHKGLHGFLYGEGGAEAHEEDFPVSDPQGNIVEGERVAIRDYIDKGCGMKVAGVYAISSKDGEHQYVGYGRSLHSALKVHSAAVGEPKCCLVEVRPLPAQAVANRARLQSEAEQWLAELGSLPPGNAHERHLWEAKVLTDVETFEEKKLKMQKAMGENLNDVVVDPSAEQRRRNLISAVSQDDWSSVIAAQTEETVDAQPQLPSKDVSSQAVPGPLSPFSTASVQEGIGRTQEAQLMTVESVDKALEEVRPFLIADGGNVEVADVSNGCVSLRLQGACGTCASSSSTMKMGIERALKGAFGEALKDVKQVDAQDVGATVHSVNAHLDMLRPAIKSYGGSVEVTAVEGGQCKIKYDGPPTIGAGITAAIKNQFPDITDVFLRS